MGDTSNGSWTSRELGIHLVKEIKVTPEDMTKAVSIISEQIKVLEEVLGGDELPNEQFTRLTGLPGSLPPQLTSHIHAKRGVSASDLSKEAVYAVFDILLVGCALGFAHGLKQGEAKVLDLVSEESEAVAEKVRQKVQAATEATPDAKAASESAI